jgi:hypothetical protein
MRGGLFYDLVARDRDYPSSKTMSSKSCGTSSRENDKQVVHQACVSIFLGDCKALSVVRALRVQLSQARAGAGSVRDNDCLL